jgi:curved DNA-binding protein CbpA
MTNPDAQAQFAAHVSTLAASLDRISYYQLLGVPQDASADDVKRAYHRVAGIYHPDAHRAAAEPIRSSLTVIFKRLSEAYRVLNDHQKRQKYDALLDQGAQRMATTKREQVGPKSPDATLKTPAGKRCFMHALQLVGQKNYAQAKLNLQLALNYEGQGCQAVKDKIAEVDQLMRQK